MSWRNVKDEIGKWITHSWTKANKVAEAPPPIFGIVRPILIFFIIFYALWKLEPIIPDDAQDADVVSAQLFQILFILIVLGGALGAAVYQYISTALTAKTEKKVEDAKHEMEKQITFSAFYTLTLFYASISASWWEHYAPAWMNYSDPRNCETETPTSASDFKNAEFHKAKTEVRIAKSYAERGLRHHKAIPKNETVPDGLPSLTYIEIALINNRIYHTTVEAILYGYNLDQTLKDELIGDAKLLLTAAAQPENHNDWYELHETAGFVMYQNGREDDRKRGKEIICNLCNGKCPPNSQFKMPDADWCNSLKEKCNRAKYYNILL